MLRKEFCLLLFISLSMSLKGAPPSQDGSITERMSAILGGEAHRCCCRLMLRWIGWLEEQMINDEESYARELVTSPDPAPGPVMRYLHQLEQKRQRIRAAARGVTNNSTSRHELEAGRKLD